ncbi:unnamed protein product [Mytilus edulis]|uniref:C-type lectin domain-containing protein n=1 Tax=Mytilus edulis TaxID=6550 RepID=A0A8S3RIB5_MYTED|nr:unnamed protein product [Mytilus edulis]
MNMIDVQAESIVVCAMLCSYQDKCCVASFEKLTSSCWMDTSENCSVSTYTVTGWNVMHRRLYVPPSCADCYSYATSTYKIIVDTVDWQTAQNNCYHLGGKLVEIETIEENDFIKYTLTNRNADTIYYLGGYQFNANDGIRWINTPSQVMTFTDWAAGDPNNPTTELCLGSYGPANFQWVNLSCNRLESYICEFLE